MVYVNRALGKKDVPAENIWRGGGVKKEKNTR